MVKQLGPLWAKGYSSCWRCIALGQGSENTFHSTRKRKPFSLLPERVVKRTHIFVVGLAFSGLLFERVSAHDYDPHLEFGKAAAKTGYGIARLAIQGVSPDTSLGDARLNRETNRILESISRAYNKRDSDRTAYAVMDANSEMVIAATSLGFLSGGASLPVVTLGAAASNYLMDFGIGGLARKSEEEAIRFLYSVEDKLIESAGLSVPQLAELEPDEIEKRLKQSDVIQQELNERFGSDRKEDQDARDFAQDVVISAIQNVAVAAHERIKQQEDDFSSFVRGTVEYRSNLESVLTDHEEQLGDLEKSLTELTTRVATVEAQLKKTNTKVEFLSDHVFSRMRAGEKANALRSGFMADRFACRENMSRQDCVDLQDTRAALIGQFEQEAKIEKEVRELSKFADNLGKANQILVDAGLIDDIPELSEAVSVAQKGTQAYAQYLAGDYLGALSSVTSAFGGGRKDPAEERFKAMLGFLEAQFEAVHRKLDAILENQQRIMDGLGDLSRQMAKTYKALDEKLDRIVFEQKVLAELVRNMTWLEWESCHTIFDEAHQQESNGEWRYGFNTETMDFDRLEGVMRLRVGVEPGFPQDCLATMSGRFTSINAIEIFGNFLSVAKVSNLYEEGLGPNSDDAEFVSKSDLDWFVSEIVLPTNQILRWYHEASDNKQRTWAGTFVALAYPRLSVWTPVATIDSPCGERRTLGSLSELLCTSIGPADSAGSTNRDLQAHLQAMRSLVDTKEDKTGTTQVAPDLAIRIAEWSLVAARIADIRYPQGSGSESVFAQEEGEFIEAAAAYQGGQSVRWTYRSERLLTKLDVVLSLAIASNNKLYGVPTVLAVIDALGSEDDGRKEKALRLLKKNHRLRRSVVTRLLMESGSDVDGDRLKFPGTTYQFALDYANYDPEHDVSMLSDLFDDSDLYSFTYDSERSWPAICFTSEICGLVPLTVELQLGQMHYPESTYRLVAIREQVRRRLNEYTMFRELSEDESTQVARILLH